MSSPANQPARLFTIEQANATLPLVRAITTDLATLARDVMERRHRLSLLSGNRNPKPGDPYSDELAHMRDELERDAQRLQEYVDELRDLGVEPKGAIEGLIDFPAYLEGRIVYLCWRLGEPEVLFWHDIDAGFAGRQSLTADTVSGSDDSDRESFSD